jgi:magnesium chelatase subunit I
VDIVKRRTSFEADPDAFAGAWEHHESQLRRKIVSARKKLSSVETSDSLLHRAAELCLVLKTDGLRGQLTLVRTAKAFAAFEGHKTVGEKHLKRVAGMALRHRLRRNPLDETGSTVRIERAVLELFGP